LRRYRRKYVEVGVIRRGGSLSANISGGWGQFPATSHWSGKTRDIPVSRGVEILTDDYFILSQYMHLTDRRTDGRTDRIATAIPCIALYAVAR